MASNQQINRWYELTIGDGKTFQAVVITPPMNLTFNVTKSSTALKNQNSAEIEIYNLPQEVLKVLENDYPVAFLKVGYKSQELITIIKGEIVSASTRKAGPDKITQVLLGSGYVALNHETIQAVVPEGKTVKEVIQVLQQEMPGISKGVFSGFNINNKVLYGYSMSGTAKQTLDNICRTYNLDYNIDNDVLYVHDAAGSIGENYALAPLINESSGLVELPYETKVKVGIAKKSVNNKGGVHFKVLLNPTLQAGSIVKIESSTVNGWFKISDLRHTGGNRTNDWYTECKCEDKTKSTDNSLGEDDEQ